MRSILQTVAFSNAERSGGIIALLETALEALEEDGEQLAATAVSLVLEHYSKKIALEQEMPIENSGDVQ
jgi:hypothetical protein